MNRLLIITLAASLLAGCVIPIPSEEFTNRPEASGLFGKCYEIQKPSIVFEAVCADLSGINNNTEKCDGIQAMGEGGFPYDWSTYLENRAKFDNALFSKLLFDKQRTMLFPVAAGTKITISRVVHHGWGTVGRFWVMRGTLHTDSNTEVELPSYSWPHDAPFWLDGRSSNIPQPNPEYLQPCDD